MLDRRYVWNDAEGSKLLDSLMDRFVDLRSMLGGR